MLPLAEAQSRVLAGVAPLAAERVPLARAVGRVLAHDLVSAVALPPFDYSAMDGYAIELTTPSSTARPVVGESKAGTSRPAPLAVGSAMRIFTGAPIPDGATAVVMQEETTRAGDVLTLTGAPRLADHIRRAGEDLAIGAVALARGTRIRTTHVAMLAAMEAVEPVVHRRPIVSILATGDELRTPGSPSREGSIVETNGLSVAAMVRAAGGIPRLHPIAADDAAILERALGEALEGVDVAITIGGVSVGDHDRVKPTLEKVGVALDFWKVSIKPGKPLVVGRRGATRFLGLPGNPVSAMLTFLLFGAPLLRTLEGDRAPMPRTMRARLAGAIKHTPGRTELVRATMHDEGGHVVVRPLRGQSSGSIPSIAAADALVVVPIDAPGLDDGAEVEVMPLI